MAARIFLPFGDFAPDRGHIVRPGEPNHCLLALNVFPKGEEGYLPANDIVDVGFVETPAGQPTGSATFDKDFIYFGSDAGKIQEANYITGNINQVHTGASSTSEWSLVRFGDAMIATNFQNPVVAQSTRGAVFSTLITAGPFAPVDAQDETDYDNVPPNGTFAGGTGHAAADVITLSDASTVTVDVVAGGVVTEFTVDSTTSIGSVVAGSVVTQVSTDGSGVVFSLTLGADNVDGPFLQAKYVEKFGHRIALANLKTTARTALGPAGDYPYTVWVSGFEAANNFDVLNLEFRSSFITMTSKYGPIIGIAESGDVMIVLFERGIESLNVGDGLIGTGGLFRNDLVEGVGCIHPRSIVSFAGQVFFWGPAGPSVVNRTVTSGVGYHELGADKLSQTLLSAIWPVAVAIHLQRTSFPISGQDELDYNNSPPNGTFFGGTSHVVSDVITLSDGTAITVDGMFGGVVNQFTVSITESEGSVIEGTVLTQVSTTGIGVVFSLTLGADNVSTTPQDIIGTLVASANCLVWRYPPADAQFRDVLLVYNYRVNRWSIITFRRTGTGTLLPVNGQDETDYDDSPTTEGTFLVGSGHKVDDILTFADGSTVTVEVVVEPAGNVTEFTVDSTTSTGAGVADGATLLQANTTGGGSGFALLLGADNVVAGTTIDNTIRLLEDRGDVPDEPWELGTTMALGSYDGTNVTIKHFSPTIQGGELGDAAFVAGPRWQMAFTEILEGPTTPEKLLLMASPVKGASSVPRIDLTLNQKKNPLTGDGEHSTLNISTAQSKIDQDSGWIGLQADSDIGQVQAARLHQFDLQVTPNERWRGADYEGIYLEYASSGAY